MLVAEIQASRVAIRSSDLNILIVAFAFHGLRVHGGHDLDQAHRDEETGSHEGFFLVIYYENRVGDDAKGSKRDAFVRFTFYKWFL